MYVEVLEVVGLAGLPEGPRTYSQVERVVGPWHTLRPLRDALRLALVLVDAEALRTLLADWGARDVEVTGDPLVEGATWAAGASVRAAFSSATEPQIRVRATFHLDPPQFAELRHHALRDVRLVDSLGGGPTLELHAGVRLGADGRSLAVEPLGVAVGGVDHPVAGPERPAWLLPLLRRLRGRVAATPLPPARWGEAAAAWDVDVQRGLRDAIHTLSLPPAEVPGLVPLPGEPGVLDGPRVVPLRWLPPWTQAAVGWVGRVCVERPDVVVVLDGPTEGAWAAWWARQVEADSAPVEQVILLVPDDERPA